MAKSAVPKSYYGCLVFFGMLEELDKRTAEIPLDRLHHLASITDKIITQGKFYIYLEQWPSAIAAVTRGFVDTFNQRRPVNPTTVRNDLPALRSTSRAREFRSINLDED